MSFINTKSIRAYCNKHGRRAGKEFIKRLEMDLVNHLEAAVEVKDGGKLTLGPAVADWIGLKFPKYMPPATKRKTKGRPVLCSKTEFVKKEDK